jgi:hypothetical protein
MTPPVRALIKTALLYLAIGLALWAFLLLDAWLGISPILYPFRQTYTQFLLVGWLGQFLIGLACWKLPPATPSRTGETWLIYGLLNGGLLLWAIAEPLYTFRGWPLLGLLVALAGLLQLAAGLIFIIAIWSRVR